MPEPINTIKKVVSKVVGGREIDRKPAADEKTILTEIDTQIEDDKKFRQKWEIEAYVNRSFIDGAHHVQYDRNDMSLRNIPVKRGEKRRTINYVRAQKRGVMALIFRNDPKVHVRAGGMDADQDELDVAYYFIKKLWRDWNLGQIVKKVASYGLDNGLGRIMWDGDPNHPSKMRFWTEDPLQLFCDAPMSGNIQDSTYFIRTFRRPLYALQHDPLYKDAEEKFKNITSEEKFSVSDRLNDWHQYKHSQGQAKDDYTGQAIVKERQIKEYDKDGKVKIRVHTKVGDELIRDELVNRDHYNVLDYRPEEQPGVYYTRAWVSDMIDPQKSINECFSSVEAWIAYVYKVKLLAKKGQKFSFRSDGHGQVIRYTGQQAPTFEQPRPLPEAIFKHQDNAVRFMEQQTIHSESQGRLSGSAASGVAIAQLQAANVNNVNEPIQNLKIFLEDLFERILQYASENYTEVRKLVFETRDEKPFEKMIVGEEALKKDKTILGEGRTEKDVVKLKAFKNIEVEIIPGDAFSDLQARSDAIELLKLEAIPKEAVLDVYKMGNTKELLDKLKSEQEEERINNPDLMIAEGENLKMAQGSKVEAQPGEDHEVHLAVHGAFLQAVEKQGNQELMNMVVQHIQNHEAMVQYENEGAGGPAAPTPEGAGATPPAPPATPPAAPPAV